MSKRKASSLIEDIDRIDQKLNRPPAAAAAGRHDAPAAAAAGAGQGIVVEPAAKKGKKQEIVLLDPQMDPKFSAWLEPFLVQGENDILRMFPSVMTHIKDKLETEKQFALKVIAQLGQRLPIPGLARLAGQFSAPETYDLATLNAIAVFYLYWTNVANSRANVDTEFLNQLAQRIYPFLDPNLVNSFSQSVLGYSIQNSSIFEELIRQPRLYEWIVRRFSFPEAEFLPQN